jgi:hypothetical protein
VAQRNGEEDEMDKRTMVVRDESGHAEETDRILRDWPV